MAVCHHPRKWYHKAETLWSLNSPSLSPPPGAFTGALQRRPGDENQAGDARPHPQRSRHGLHDGSSSCCWARGGRANTPDIRTLYRQADRLQLFNKQSSRLWSLCLFYIDKTFMQMWICAASFNRSSIRSIRGRTWPTLDLLVNLYQTKPEES